MNGYLSDSEARIVMQQLVEIVNDVYSNNLCIYDFSPENFLTHFESSKVLLAPEEEARHVLVSGDVPIEYRPKQRSNTIALTQTEKFNSLV